MVPAPKIPLLFAIITSAMAQSTTVVVLTTVSPSSTATATPSSSVSRHHGLSAGAIAGIVIGVVVAFLILLAVAFFCCCRGILRKRKERKQNMYHGAGEEKQEQQHYPPPTEAHHNPGHTKVAAPVVAQHGSVNNGRYHDPQQQYNHSGAGGYSNASHTQHQSAMPGDQYNDHATSYNHHQSSHGDTPAGLLSNEMPGNMGHGGGSTMQYASHSSGGYGNEVSTSSGQRIITHGLPDR